MLELCPWCGTDPLYVAYHDAEWGVPERDPRALFEMLILEGFQAGLSWYTILKKQENFRVRFAGFDPEALANWGEQDVLACLDDPGIVRHRGKIEATIKAGPAWLEIEAREGFAAWIWRHVEGQPIQNHHRTMADVPAETAMFKRLSKELKAAGFNYCGPTISYAFMQATGMVNDHLVGCPRHAALSG